MVGDDAYKASEPQPILTASQNIPLAEASSYYDCYVGSGLASEDISVIAVAFTDIHKDHLAKILTDLMPHINNDGGMREITEIGKKVRSWSKTRMIEEFRSIVQFFGFNKETAFLILVIEKKNYWFSDKKTADFEKLAVKLIDYSREWRTKSKDHVIYISPDFRQKLPDWTSIGLRTRYRRRFEEQKRQINEGALEREQCQDHNKKNRPCTIYYNVQTNIVWATLMAMAFCKWLDAKGK